MCGAKELSTDGVSGALRWADIEAPAMMRLRGARRWRGLDELAAGTARRSSGLPRSSPLCGA